MTKKELKYLIIECRKELLKESDSLIHKFVYFGFNYPNNWVNEVWKDNPTLAKHLNTKFHSIYNKVGARAAVNTFYTELDSENQHILEDWINNNYND
ncbi:MAG: hypothetical protein M0R17_10320 [Candidatus Omnitrophica bacterium]|jgi:hypothetical protein|nr:hypothetical protein [Candidatus Omnitrophota bacterium]